MQKLDFYDIIHGVDEETNISDNNSSSEVLGATVRRRPGRPKGLPKPPGSGRQKNTPNKVTRDIREAASKHGTKALAALVRLLDSPDPKIVATAAREVLDRAYGRPMTPSEISGPDGKPLRSEVLHADVSEMSNLDVVRRLLFAANREARAKLPDGAPLPATRDGLRRVLDDEPWSPTEPEEVEARAAMYRTAARPRPADDPFAADRAAQAALIESARINETVGDTPYSTHAAVVVAQNAERDIARAEKRQERPIPAYVEPGGSLAEHGLSPRHRNVVRFKPR